MRNFAQANSREYNKVRVNGYLYGHALEKRVSKKGVEYIGGVIEVATDDDLLNIVKVTLTYVTATTKAGKDNATYALLSKIIDSNPTVKNVGKDAAMFVRIEGDIEKNDYVSGQTNEIVEQTRVRGSFVNEGSRGDMGARFDADMLISAYDERESTDGSTYGVVRGYIFNFRNEFLPVQFNIPQSSGGMEYFASQNIDSTNPLLTHVWGEITTTVKSVESESAFGVRATSRQLRSWDITGAAGEPYEFGDETVMTMDDVKAGLDARAVHLAEVRAAYEERQQAAKGGNSFASAASTSEGSKAHYQF